MDDRPPRTRDGRPRRPGLRRTVAAGTTLLAVGLLALPAMAAPAPTATPAPAGRASSGSESPTAPAPATASGPAAGGNEPGGSGSDDGRTLYQQSCAGCHGQQGQGSQLGPSLVSVGDAAVDFYLSTGRMPVPVEQPANRHREPVFTDEQIRALVGYVGTFGAGGPPIPSVKGGPVNEGRALYLENCAPCHSATGVGYILTNGQVIPSVLQASATQVGEAIRVGPGLMPAYPASKLSDADVDSIAGYVRALQNQNGNLDRGGASLGRIGPVPEGAIGWGVGVLLLVLLARWLGTRAAR